MSDKCWVSVARVDLETAEFPVQIVVNDEQIIICKIDDQLYAVQRNCPHADGDLSAGVIMGDKIKCPLHGFMFRLKDGKGINAPRFNLRTFDLIVDGGVAKIAVEQ